MADAKRRGPLSWVILGVVVLIAILGVVLWGFGYYAAEKNHLTVGTANPGFAAVKILVSSNPNLEIIREEPEKAQILVRDKTTGEYFLHRANDETKSMERVPMPADQVK